MIVCVCRSFNCTAARDAIQRHRPERAEDVHRHVSGEPPQCGACLSVVDAMLERYRKDGVVPDVKDITTEENLAAQKRLGERFANENKNAPAQERPPAYKRRYIRILSQR